MMSKSGRFGLIAAARLVTALAASSLVACNQLDKVQSQIDEINKTLKEGQKNVTDVGVISELGWVSKMIRDSATGTPSEQAKAKNDAARLFGIDPAALGQAPFFEVTVQLRDFQLTKDQQLELDTKYLADVTPQAIKAVFDAAPGNAWEPYSVRDPDEYNRTPEAIRKLVEERVATLISQGCHSIFGSPTVGCSTAFTSLSGTVIPIATEEEKILSTQKTKLVRQFADAILAPSEIAGLPPSGSRNGQRVVDWGLTAGASPYLVVFVPQGQVKMHPTLTLSAWLHLKGLPDKILGPGYQLKAVDFASRCLSGNTASNPTPPVDSKSSAGPLCWYAFDLFGAGVHSQLDQLRREAGLRGQQN